MKKASRKKKVAKKKSAGPDTVTTPAPPSRTRKQRPTSKPERRPEAQPAQLDTKMRGDVPAATPSANKKRRDGGATDSKGYHFRLGRNTDCKLYCTECSYGGMQRKQDRFAP